MSDNETLKLQRNLSALVEFSRIVNSSLDLDFTLNNLLFSCMGKFLTTRGFVVVEEEGHARIRSAKGIHSDAVTEFNLKSFSTDNSEGIAAAFPALGAKGNRLRPPI